MANDVVVGIDLGTTNSAIAVMENGAPRVIKNENGMATVPSVVHLENPEAVGEDALKYLTSDPARTVFASKRLIGRKMADIKDYVKLLPYKTFEKCNGDVWIKTEGSKYSPVEVGAKILERLKTIGEGGIQRPVKKAVITVPAYFDDAQRQATRDAGKIAGLDVLRIVNEPTAAALAYGLDKNKKGHVAVYDLGGGTFDISILELDNGVFHVKATAGDTFLGGEDFDNELVGFLLHRFEEDEGFDFEAHVRQTVENSESEVAISPAEKEKRVAAALSLSKARIKLAAEDAKKRLSNEERTRVVVRNFVDGRDLDLQLTRGQLESVVRRVAERTRGPCERALKDAGVKKSDIADVILVGGMTRMPAIRKLANEIFERPPRTDINPDEAVALGAAVQGAVLAGAADDLLLLDVTPLSLGIEVLGGVFSRVVDRNTTIPCKHTEVFSTSEDNQTEVDLRIYQGERPMVADNRLLGSLKLTGIPPAPRGVPKIAVTFEADADGCIRVHAEDSVTKQPAEARLRPSTGLTRTEVDKMVQEAAENREADKKKEAASLFRMEALGFANRAASPGLPTRIQERLKELRELVKPSVFDIDRAKEMLTSLKGVL